MDKICFFRFKLDYWNPSYENNFAPFCCPYFKRIPVHFSISQGKCFTQNGLGLTETGSLRSPGVRPLNSFSVASLNVELNEGNCRMEINVDLLQRMYESNNKD